MERFYQDLSQAVKQVPTPQGGHAACNGRLQRINFGNVAPIVGCRQLPCRSTVISIGGDSRVVVIECLRGQSIGPVAFPLITSRTSFLALFLVSILRSHLELLRVIVAQ